MGNEVSEEERIVAGVLEERGRLEYGINLYLLYGGNSTVDKIAQEDFRRYRELSSIILDYII